MNETTKDLPRLEIQLEQEKERNVDSANPSNLVRRLQAKIELIEMGCAVQETIHGLLVNDKFIVGIGSRKWCTVGKYKWYPYSDLATFVSRFVKHTDKEIETAQERSEKIQKPLTDGDRLFHRSATLRDYFAAKAMQGLYSRVNWLCADVAERAYQQADAMLEARK